MLDLLNLSIEIWVKLSRFLDLFEVQNAELHYWRLQFQKHYSHLTDLNSFVNSLCLFSTFVYFCTQICPLCTYIYTNLNLFLIFQMIC